LTERKRGLHSAPLERGYRNGVTTEATRRVLLIGAGGHARVCLEALLDDPSNDVVGAVSRDGLAANGLGIEVLGRDVDALDIAQRQRLTTFCVAIGNNIIRQRFGKMLTERGHVVTSAISRFAMLSRSCSLADGVQILPGAVVNAATTIGDGVIVNTNASVDHDCSVGAYVHIAPGVAIGGDVTIGAGALIGIGSRILPGLTIGAGTIVGGGAVVVDDVPAGATVVGVPARAIRREESEA